MGASVDFIFHSNKRYARMRRIRKWKFRESIKEQVDESDYPRIKLEAKRRREEYMEKRGW